MQAVHVVGMVKLGVDDDASCIITHAYQTLPATVLLFY